MKTISFFVPGEPRPTARARTFTNKAGFTQTITDPSGKVKPWREKVARAAKGAPCQKDGKNAPLVPWTGPCTMTAVFYFKRPQGHFTTKGELSAEGKRRRAPMGGVGDWDNLGKAVSDALEGLVFRDDAQLCSVMICKRYCGGDEPEGVHVTLRAMEWATVLYESAPG